MHGPVERPAAEGGEAGDAGDDGEGGEDLPPHPGAGGLWNSPTLHSQHILDQSETLQALQPCHPSHPGLDSQSVTEDMLDHMSGSHWVWRCGPRQGAWPGARVGG